MAVPNIITTPTTGPMLWTDNAGLQGITDQAVRGFTEFMRLRNMIADAHFDEEPMPRGRRNLAWRFVNDFKVHRAKEGQSPTNYQSLQFYQTYADIALYQVAAYVTDLADWKSPESLPDLIIQAMARAMAVGQNESAIAAFTLLPLQFGSTSEAANGEFFLNLIDILSQGVPQVQNSPFVESPASTILLMNHSQIKAHLMSLTGIYQADTSAGVSAAKAYDPNDVAVRGYSGDGFPLPGGTTIRIDNNIPIVNNSAIALAAERGSMIRPTITPLNKMFRDPDSQGMAMVLTNYWNHGVKNPNRGLQVITSANAPAL